MTFPLLAASRMALCVATMHDSDAPGDIPNAIAYASEVIPVHVRRNTPEDNLGVVKSYQWLYEHSTEEILCFIHDDVIIHEDRWDQRIMAEFDDPHVGIIGMGGARWHGTPDLYKVRYHLPHLRRGDYLSNVDDAEVHGTRFTGVSDVAVLDGFCLVVRRSLLRRVGGFQLLIDNAIDFLCYDYALCALARRYNYRIRTIGIRCHHRGGQTSLGVDRTEEYERSHSWFYNEFKDVLPASVK